MVKLSFDDLSYLYGYLWISMRHKKDAKIESIIKEIDKELLKHLLHTDMVKGK